MKTTTTLSHLLTQVTNPGSENYNIDTLTSLIPFEVVSNSVFSFTVILPNKDKFGLELESNVSIFWESKLTDFLKSHFGGATIYDALGIYQSTQEKIKVFHVEVFQYGLQKFQNSFSQVLLLLRDFQLQCNQDSIGLFINQKFSIIRFKE